MKRTKDIVLCILLAIVVVAITGCGKKENNSTEQVKENNPIKNFVVDPDQEYDTSAKFSYDDMIIGSLKYGMTEDEVKAVIGEPPRRVENKAEESIYGESVDYLFEDLQLSFYKHNGKMILSSAYTGSRDYVFTKGLRVGDTKDQVISSFQNEGTDEDKMREISSAYEGVEAFGKYLYGHGLEDVKDGVKESGNVDYAFINYYNYDSSNPDASYMIEYRHAEPPYVSNYATSSDEMGSLVFDINNEGIVTSIRWYFTPKAE